MSEALIEVRGLKKHFGTIKAVDGIDLTVEKGRIFAFLGPNGAGKTTTINILITLMDPDEGEVMVAGFDPRRDLDETRRAIGVVFQDQLLDEQLTVSEILRFHGHLYGLSSKVIGERIDHLLEVVDLEDRRDTLTKQLSGGMKRRLEIARGLLTRPQVLFLDEPTIGLDPQTRAYIWDHIREIRDRGVTVFLTTHYMDEAEQLADDIAIIDHGRIIARGTPAELKSELGRDIVYLRTEDDQRAQTALAGISVIREIKDTDPGLSVILEEEGAKALPTILERLSASDIGVTHIRLQEPTLDDVFLHHTGRGLRDDPISEPSEGEK